MLPVTRQIARAVLLAGVFLVLGLVAAPSPATEQTLTPAPGAKKQPVKVKWEYQVLTAPDIEKLAGKGSRDRFTDGLNRLGDQGWELVTVVPGGPAGGGLMGMGPPGGAPRMPPALPKIKPHTYLFKRPR
jgi:hypothetical protein